MSQVKDLPEGHSHCCTVPHLLTCALFLTPVRSGRKGYFMLGLPNTWLKTPLQTWIAWFYSKIQLFAFMTLSRFYWPDSTSHCMRGKAQGEVVLEIKTNINLSAAHLSKMLSNKWQSCGLTLTSHLYYSGLQNRDNELWAFMCACLCFCVCLWSCCALMSIFNLAHRLSNCSLNTACSYGVAGQGQIFTFSIQHYIIFTVSSYALVLEEVCVCVWVRLVQHTGQESDFSWIVLLTNKKLLFLLMLLLTV